MAMANHIEALEKTRAGLDALLRAEEGHAWHNRARVIRLKQQKLHLRDEIERLRLVAHNDTGMADNRADVPPH